MNRWKPATFILATICFAVVGLAEPPAVIQNGSVVRAEMRDILEEALDQPVERLVIEDKPIREAFTELQENTGVPLQISDEVVSLMPYGSRTRISLNIEKMSVRKACERLFRGLGLEMVVADTFVDVVPSAVLDWTGRRLTLEEITLLGQLAAKPWSALDSDVAVAFDLERPMTGDEFGEEMAQMPDTLSASEQLTELMTNLGGGWLLEGKTIVLRSYFRDVESRLSRPIDLGFQSIPLDELLQEIGIRLGVTMFFEPGCLKDVDASDRTVSITQRAVSARQTLERLCGNTGLKYSVETDGIHFAGPKSKRSKGVGRSPRLLRINLIVTDGASVDYILREDELPEPLRERCKALLDEALAKLLKSIEAE